MEPLLPVRFDAGLLSLARRLIQTAGRLGEDLHPDTRARIAELIRATDAHYSYVLCGNGVKRAALKLDYRAHRELDAELESRRDFLAERLFSTTVFKWLHAEIFGGPQRGQRQKGSRRRGPFRNRPGEFRVVNLRHSHESVPDYRKVGPFLKSFAQFYGPFVTEGSHTVLAAAAAHHRLLWIHPFPDGNGRVARLLARAWLGAAGAGGGGLWSLSRALARRRTEYFRALSRADARKVDRFDGRGHLSEKHLAEFCRFFLGAALEEVKFMGELLKADALLDRITAFCIRGETSRRLPHSSTALVRELFLEGDLARGDVPDIVGTSARTAQKIIGELLAQGLLASNSPKGILRLGLGAEVAKDYFPGLGPKGLMGQMGANH